MSMLAGKVAIVGGSSEGIGYGIARRLAGDGADVALVARRAEKLEAAATTIRDETGRNVFTVAADTRDTRLSR
jgi:3-oxoacyl-[acyl-carrier protein] reductase